MTYATDHIEGGFFKLRLAKGAPYVGAIIYIPCPIEMHPEFWNPIDRPMHAEAMINGKPCEVWKIPDYAEPIKQPEYDYLLADRAWAEEFDPSSPEANPYQTVEKPKKAKKDKKQGMKITDIPLDSLRP